MIRPSIRLFANIDFESIKPENSILKAYNKLVKDDQIRADPNQIAVVNYLDKWQQNFVTQVPRLQDF